VRIFKDREGTAWTIDITVTAIKRVRAGMDIDLLTAAEGQMLIDLADDEVKMVDLIYWLCKPEAEKRGVSDEQFGEAMLGEAIERAYDAFMEDLADFFRDPAKRRVMRTMLEKAKRLQTKQMAMIEEKLNDPKIDALIDMELKKAGDGFTKLLELRASTPDP
jgi:hypothetical protein